MATQKRFDNNFTRRFNEIIEANLSNERFGVSELAHEMHMSRSNLHRRIKSETGTSVSQFLRKTRLNQALALLKEGSLTVSEVAFRVGFGSPAYFTKCFRDYFGFPPGETEISSLNDPDPVEPTSAGHSDEYKNQMHKFPVQTTSFIGREKEMETLHVLIEEHRIVSLVGTGGCGKTRLACEAVSRSAKEYRDGIWFVELAPVGSEALVPKQLMDTLDIAEVPDKDMEETLIEGLREKELLILLDNCEHLLGACAEVAGRLSEAVPGLSILTTSREALNAKGERVWITPPLTLIEPASILDVEHARSAESIRLYSDRALLHNPGFELAEENLTDVATICKKVDGIPLAIELVSSRTRHMDSATLLDRLSGRFAEISSRDPRTIERQKTLQATIEWSYNLLNEDEKALFRRLSVFTGGFDLAAAEEVCVSKTLPKEKILDLLSRLIDTSMIQASYRKAGEMRYGMLETLRQYGSNQLTENNEAEETSTKHLEYFTRISDQAYEERMSSLAHWLEITQLEHNNMLAALRWSELHDPGRHVTLAGNLSWFWARSNHYSTATEILNKVIASNSGEKLGMARLYTGFGSLLVTAGEFLKSIDLLKKALSLWRKIGNHKEEAIVLAEISNSLYTMGNDEAGLKYAEEAYELAKGLNDEGVLLYSMMVVSQGLVDLKKTGEARRMAMKVLKLAERLENPFGIYVGHHQLGDCGLLDGKYNESERDYGLGLRTTIKINDTSFTCVEMLGVAMSVAGQGRYAKALRINAAATLMAKSNESLVPEEYPLVFWHELVLQHIVGTREKLGEELTQQYEEEGRSMSFEKAVDYTLDFDRD